MMTLRPAFMAAFAGLFMMLGVCVFMIRMPYGHEAKIAIKSVNDCGDGPRQTIIHVLENGQVLLNGEALQADELQHRLHDIFSTRAERIVFLTASPDVAFQQVAGIVDLADAEVDYVALLTPAVQNAPGRCLTIQHVPLLFDVAMPHLPPAHVKEVPVWQIWKR